MDGVAGVAAGRAAAFVGEAAVGTWTPIVFAGIVALGNAGVAVAVAAVVEAGFAAAPLDVSAVPHAVRSRISRTRTAHSPSARPRRVVSLLRGAARIAIFISALVSFLISTLVQAWGVLGAQ